MTQDIIEVEEEVNKTYLGENKKILSDEFSTTRIQFYSRINNDRKDLISDKNCQVIFRMPSMQHQSQNHIQKLDS